MMTAGGPHPEFTEHSEILLTGCEWHIS